jgi:hypothetical protein
MRQMRARRRAEKASAPVPFTESRLAVDPEQRILECFGADPQQAARWLRDLLGEDAAHRLGRALAPPPAWSDGPQLLDLDLIRRAPITRIPWIVDRLVEDDPLVLRDALESALRSLAQVLQAVYGSENSW